MALNIEPHHSEYTLNGGMNKHEIINTTDTRHAFKVGLI
jgi:hypothetical protein